MATLTDFIKTDLFNDHVAGDVNKLIAAALRAEYTNTETITGTKELTDNDCPIQIITPSGADRTVELAPESTSNHVTVVYNASGTYNVVVKDDSGATTFATITPATHKVFLPLNAQGWKNFETYPTATTRYKLNVSVAANDLTVALKHIDGTDPSSIRPIEFLIDGTNRQVTSALSVTLADGTNWFGMGQPELATQEVDLFVYVVWDSGSNVVDIALGRQAHCRIVSEWSSSSTANKYLSNYSSYATTDAMQNIGRVPAILSAGAAYTWSIPTLNATNVINEPSYSSRTLIYVPQWSSSGTQPTLGNGTLTGIYRLEFRDFYADTTLTMGSTTTYGTGSYSISLPFGLTAAYPAACWAVDTGTTHYTGTGLQFLGSTTSINAVTSGGASLWGQTLPFTWGNTDVMRMAIAGRL